jgi:hypothetical protein
LIKEKNKKIQFLNEKHIYNQDDILDFIKKWDGHKCLSIEDLQPKDLEKNILYMNYLNVNKILTHNCDTYKNKINGLEEDLYKEINQKKININENTDCVNKDETLNDKIIESDLISSLNENIENVNTLNNNTIDSSLTDSDNIQIKNTS